MAAPTNEYITRTEVVGRIKDLREEFKEDLKEIKESVEGVNTSVTEGFTKMNGRVKSLEQAKIFAAGFRSAFSWVPSTLAAVLATGLTLLVTALTGGFH